MNPLWGKAPLLLLRWPGLLASLAVGALLLALAAAASPLFISAQTSELVAAEVENPNLTRYGAGILYQTSELEYDETAPGRDGEALFGVQNDVFAERVARSPHFGPIVNTVLGPEVAVGGPDGGLGEDPGRLIARTDALAHVEKLRGTDGDGVWITNFVADHLNVKPGDELTLRSESGEVRVRVDGIYRALNEQPRTGYWRALSREIYPVCSDCAAPAPFVIADYDQVVQMAKALGVSEGVFAREAPLAPNREFTVNDIRAVEEFAADFRQDMGVGQGIDDVAECCHRNLERFGFEGYDSNFITFIPQVVDAVESRVATVEGPVQLLLVAGILVAGVVIAAAGAFAVATRRVEATLLYARGLSPPTIAIKACLEAVIPCLIGSAVGLGVAVLVVRFFGPPGPVDSTALASAARAAALAVPASVILLGAVSAVAFLRQSEHHSARFGYLAKFPWELAFLGVALWFWLRLDSGGALVHDESLDVNRPSIFLLLFPLALLAGFAIVGARAFRAVLAALRERSGGYRPSTYLTVHRLAGAPGLTILLFAASALCLGTFVHAETIVGSLETTVDAKAKIFVGSDVQATFDLDYEPPADFPMPLTKTTRLPTAGTIEPGGARFDLLAIDPDSLADAAYWNPAFGADSLHELARGIKDDGSGPVKIIASGVRLPEDVNLAISGEVIPAHVTAETRSFPGTSSDLMMLVIDVRALDRTFEAGTPLEDARASTEFWVKGDTQAGLNAVSTLDQDPYTVLTADEVKDIPSIAAVIDTFGVLNTLGLAAALLVIVVMLMYLQARQRSGVVSYALSRRMGLGDGSYRRSLQLELTALLVFSYLLGVILALGAAFVISGMVDPLETIPPDPLFVVPLAGIPVALVMLLAVAAVGGWFTNRRARQTNFAEVMRLAD
jgi:putative ABC transport system permease protein